MKEAFIHYFSGTGNTQHAAGLVKRKLEENGYHISLINIESRVKEVNDTNGLNIFMFPTYGFAPPANMISYMKQLNPAAGLKAAIICVGGHSGKEEGYDGNAAYQAERLLKKKGFDVFFRDFVSYPENFTMIINPPEEETRARIFAETDERLKVLAIKIGRLETNFNERNIIPRLITGVVNKCFLLLGRRFLGKAYIADSSCVACGRCAKTCPARVIQMIKDKPNWNWECVQCNRCINICPQHSIQTSIVKLLVEVLVIVPAILAVQLIPHQYIDLSGVGVIDAIIRIGLVFLLSLIFTYLADKLIYLMEKVPVLRKLFELTYTKHYRRYTAPGFEPIMNDIGRKNLRDNKAAAKE
jgi:flavodoxin/NAD-dependent dihydropyrimidine dehydrogenase PreA subunit